LVTTQSRLTWHPLEHFHTHLARRDFAQRGDAGPVVRLYLGRVALVQHARTVRGSQHQLKAVGDFFQAVFYGNAGHDVVCFLWRSIGNLQRRKSGAAPLALIGVPEPLGLDDGPKVQ